MGQANLTNVDHNLPIISTKLYIFLKKNNQRHFSPINRNTTTKLDKSERNVIHWNGVQNQLDEVL